MKSILRKYVIAALVFFLSTIILISEQIAGPTGLVLHYSFDETVGTTIQDEVSGVSDYVHYVFHDGDTAFPYNNYSKDHSDVVRQSGLSGKALVFDGHSTFITRNGITPQSALTVEAWVAPRAWEYGDPQGPNNVRMADSGEYISTYETTGGGARPAAKYMRLTPIVDHHDAQEGYVFGVYRHGAWGLRVRLSSGWYEIWCDPTIAMHAPDTKYEFVNDQYFLEKFEWSHIAASFDGVNGTLALYLNGTEIHKIQDSRLIDTIVNSRIKLNSIPAFF